MKKVLTIAGSDCSGGAGIQADIKTITVHKMYAMSVITALTAQNTTTDIFPDAVKIGMVSSPEIIRKIVDKLKEYQAKNIVVDPVMVSTSGSKLLSDNAMDALITRLIPMARVITPNIPEAECLSGLHISTKEDMIKAAGKIGESFQGYILIKGGHLTETADDLLYHNGVVTWFEGLRIDNDNTHGTGCTMSSAIACNIAAGYSINESVQRAKDFITCALKANLNLGKGSGPLNHCWMTQ
ncbi:MAG: bifunctional hydroxymethylpyrimidine kinase/phosphomethylpyrimidine kinase [Bacillota bacterium]